MKIIPLQGAPKLYFLNSYEAALARSYDVAAVLATSLSLP